MEEFENEQQWEKTMQQEIKGRRLKEMFGEDYIQKEYDVGYKKPPKNTRFQKGNKGNPKGRKPKKQFHKQEFESPDELFARIYNESKEVNYNGEIKKMSNAEIAMRGMFQKMSQGKSVPQAFIKLWKEYEKRQWAKKKSKLYKKRDEELRKIREIESTITYKKLRQCKSMIEAVFYYACNSCLTPLDLDNHWKPEEDTNYEIISIDPCAEDDY